jgi:hypothetical protein
MKRLTGIRGALKTGILLALLVAAALPLGALDVADGRMRLTLTEDGGRFVLSAQTRGTNGVFVPLFAAQDPRTTLLSIVVGNRVYRMGESSEFSETQEKTATGARLTWKSSFLQVTETFTFIASADSSVSNGVRIDISLKNLSEQNLTVGARYLLDTYLGESSFVHFRTDSLTQITHELALTPADSPLFWVSPLTGDAEGFGLQVMTSGRGITTPDRIVFANWKRLSDSPWSYDVSAARNFSLLPYSVNDSAVCQYYDPRTIQHEGEATISLVLGMYSRAGFTGIIQSTQVTSPVSQPGTAQAGIGTAQETAAAPPSSLSPQSVKTDLASVDRVLAQIDAALSAGGAISNEALALIESTLRDLRTHAPGVGTAASK